MSAVFEVKQNINWLPTLPFLNMGPYIDIKTHINNIHWMTSFAGILIHTLIQIYHTSSFKKIKMSGFQINHILIWKCHLSINTRYDTIRIHVQTYLKVSGLLIHQIILLKKIMPSVKLSYNFIKKNVRNQNI